MTVDLHVFKNDVLEKRAYEIILPEVTAAVSKRRLPPPHDDYIMGTVGDVPFHSVSSLAFDQGYIQTPLPDRIAIGDLQLKFVESKKQDVLYWYNAWRSNICTGQGVYGYPKDYLKIIRINFTPYFGEQFVEMAVWPKSISGYAVDNESGFIYPVITFAVQSSVLFITDHGDPRLNKLINKLNAKLAPLQPDQPLGALSQILLPSLYL